MAERKIYIKYVSFFYDILLTKGAINSYVIVESLSAKYSSSENLIVLVAFYPWGHMASPWSLSTRIMTVDNRPSLVTNCITQRSDYLNTLHTGVDKGSLTQCAEKPLLEQQEKYHLDRAISDETRLCILFFMVDLN